MLRPRRPYSRFVDICGLFVRYNIYGRLVLYTFCLAGKDENWGVLS